MDSAGLTPGATYSYAIFLRDLAGRFSPRATATAAASNPPVGMAWDSVTVPVTVTGSARSMQCPSASFCMILDDQAYQTWNGGSWSGPQPLPYQLSGFSSVSCASSTLCIIVYDRSYSIYDGQAWSLPSDLTALGPNNIVNSISCPSSDFCIATTFDGFSVEWNGSSWSAGPRFGNADIGYGDSVHCASSTLCWTQGGSEWNGTTWSTIESGSGGTGLDQMSCPSTTFCVHTTYFGAMAQYTSGQWISMTSPWPAGTQVSNVGVVCPAPTFCVSVAQGGGTDTEVSTFNGSVWSAPAILHPSIAADPVVACPSAKLCFEADSFDNHNDEQLASYANGAWTAPSVITQADRLSAVACLPSGSCHGIDFAGGVQTYDGAQWSAPTLVDPASGALNISCGTESFCAVVDDSGGAVVENAGVWGARQILTPGIELNYVSCASDNTCMAITETGVAEQYKNGAWTEVSQSAAGPVACGSANYCVASTQWWNGSTWTQIPTYPTSGRAITCVAPDDCVVALDRGEFYQPVASHLVNGAWHGPLEPIGTIDFFQWGSGITSVACASADRCIAYVNGGLNTFSSGGVTLGPTFVNIYGVTTSLSCMSTSLCVSVNNGDVSVGR